MNPYLHLSRKVKDLLMAEAKLSAEERRANQWQLLVKFCGTQYTIGKGDVNTIFFQEGPNGERKACYPDQILDRLEELGKQKYHAYAVVNKAGKPIKRTMYESRAIGREPEVGFKIMGYFDDSEGQLQEELVMVAKTDISGSRWEKARGTKKSQA